MQADLIGSQVAETASWLLASVAQGPARGRAAVLGVDAEWVPRARRGWIPPSRAKWHEGEVRPHTLRHLFLAAVFFNYL
jgi:hypothetical protein